MGLLHIHDDYARLHEQLQYLSQSPRNQVLLIRGFLETIFREKHLELLRTYIAEMVSHLIGVIPEISSIGTPPQFFVNLRETLSRAFALVPTYYGEEDVRSALSSVHLMHMHSLLYLGEMEDDRYRESWCQLTSASGMDLGPLQRLLRLIEQYEVREEPVTDLRDIAAQWQHSITVTGESACLPVVEQNISLGAIRSFHPFGRIVCLHAMAGTPSPKEEGGRIIINSVNHGVETLEIRTELDRITKAARNLAAVIIRHPSKEQRPVQASFSDSTLPYLGSSFNLALAIEYLCLQSRHSLDSVSMAVREGTIITGPLDADGRVPPLPEDIIATKVETVFHSPFARLILPKENETEAEHCLAALRARYPHRNLKLVPIKELADAFNHREVITVRRVPIGRRFHNGLRRHNREITLGSVLGMVLVALLAIVFMVDFDSRPERVVIKENRFHILNQKDRVLWTVPIAMTDAQFDMDQGTPFESEGLYAVADVDADGSTEVLLGHPRTEPGFSDSLYCMNSDGSRKWSAFLGQPSITGEGSYLTAGFHLLYVVADNLDQDPELEIICSATNDFHTNMVYVFDHTGKKLSAYYHPGSLFTILIIRNPETKEKEILFGGTNNGLRKAVMVVLDPEFMDGACQAGPSRRLLYPEMHASSEKYYLVFPDTDLYERMPGYPFTWVAPFAQETTGLSIQKSESIGSPSSEDDSELRCAVFYYVDSMYRVRDFRTSSNFDQAHMKRKALGIISSTIDATYAKTMMSGVRYWDGDSLISTPGMTKNFKRKLFSISYPKEASAPIHKEAGRRLP